MNKIWKWILGIGAALVVMLLAMPFVGRILWWMPHGFASEVGRGSMMGGGFTGGCGGIFGGPMSGLWNMGGSLMMLGMFIVPLLLVGLVAAAVVALMRRPQTVVVQAQPTVISCASCGKVVQDNWVVCPYCGEKRA